MAEKEIQIVFGDGSKVGLFTLLTTFSSCHRFTSSSHISVYKSRRNLLRVTSKVVRSARGRMEERDCQTRAETPPTHAFFDKSRTSSRISGIFVNSEPRPGVPNGSSSRSDSNSVKMDLQDGSRTPGSIYDTDSDTQTVKREASPEVPTVASHQVSSNKNGKQGSPSKKPPKAPVQLISHYPRAEEAALATFETLETNLYQYKYLGKSKVQEDAMACECSYKPGLRAVLIMSRNAEQISCQVTPSTKPAVQIPIVSID